MERSSGNRPRVSVFIAVTLDGFIAREDGGLDWLMAIQSEPGEDYGYSAFMESVQAVVMGRNTYDTLLTFEEWPFHEKQVIVLTHRPLTPRFGESTHSGPLLPLLERLGSSGVRRLYLDGGRVIQQGLREGLVDDLILTRVPVLLGRGIPLFGPEVPSSQWRLETASAFATGLVQAVYHRQVADSPGTDTLSHR